MKTFALALIALSSASAFAAPATQKPVDRQDCQDAAYNAAYEQFQADSVYSDDDMDTLASFSPATQEGRSRNTLTIEVSSNDVYTWDGYADYEIKLRVTATSCKAISATQTRSEGI